MRARLALLASICAASAGLASGCASLSVVQDAEPVPKGQVRGGLGLGGQVQGGREVQGFLVPQIDARFGLGDGFDLGARLTALDVSLDVKGMLYRRDAVAVALAAGGGLGGDPFSSLGEGRTFQAMGKLLAIVQWRGPRLSVRGGPVFAFGPLFTGEGLDTPWLQVRAGGFFGFGLLPGHARYPDLTLFFELQGGVLHRQPVGDGGLEPETGPWFAPTVAFAWNWFAPGGIW